MVLRGEIAASLQPWYRTSLPPRFWKGPRSASVALRTRASLSSGGLEVALELEGREVPGRILEDHVPEELGGEGGDEALAGRAAGDPEGPAVGRVRPSGNVAGMDLPERGPRTGVELLQRGDLGLGQAG